VLEGLARIHRREADALTAHPQKGFLALGDQKLGHVGVAAIIGQAAEIVVILVGGVGAEIAGREFGLREIAKLQEIVDAVIDKAERTRGKAAVAAALVERGRFEDENPRALPAGCECGAHAGIAGSDNHDIELAGDHFRPLRLGLLPNE